MRSEQFFINPALPYAELRYSRALLRQGRDIADVALACGFFDQSHFHRYFKAMTTVTPQEYRINFLQ